MKPIDRFDGEYKFLSNFYLHPVTFLGLTFASSEHAYQAMKSTDASVQELFTLDIMTPGMAKWLGRQIEDTKRPNWNSVKVSFMRRILEAKFSDKELRAKLDATAPRELIEGNTWGDTFWGVCNGEGRNNLGKILMEIRDGIC